MAESYEIKLGVQLDTSDLSNIKTQLNNLYQQKKINLEFNKKSINHQINSIRNQIKNLNNIKVDLGGGIKGGAGNILNISAVDVSKVTKSFERLELSIKDIRNALGTIDDKSGMQSLLSSVKEISTAIGKATDESQNLVSSLNALSKKDFSFNLDIKFGGTNGNSFANTTAYGNYVRGIAIPQLQKQAESLMKAVREEYSTQFFEWQDDVFVLDTLSKRHSYNPIKSPTLLRKEMADGRNLSKQMSAYRDYINLIEEVGKLSGVNVNGVTSGFSKTKDTIIQDAIDIQSGVKNAVENTEEQVEKLKQVFNSGVDTASLQAILDDLNKIKIALTEMSYDSPIKILTTSLDNLSDSLNNLLVNIDKVSKAFNTNLSGSANIGSSVENEVKNISSSLESAGKQGGKRLKQGVKEGLSGGFNLNDIVDEETRNLAERFGITNNKIVSELKIALKEYRTALAQSSSIDVFSDSDIDEFDFTDDASKAFYKLRDIISDNKKVVNEYIEDYKELHKYIQETNKKGAKVLLPESVVSEYGDDYRSMRSSLGNAFVAHKKGTGQKGVGFDVWLDELNELFPHLIDTSEGIEAAFKSLYEVNQIGKGKKSIFDTGTNDASGIREIDNAISEVVNNINVAEQKAQEASNERAAAVRQNELQNQQAYKKTQEAIARINKEIEEDKKNATEMLATYDSYSLSDFGDGVSEEQVKEGRKSLEQELQRMLDVKLQEKAELESQLAAMEQSYEKEVQAAREVAQITSQSENEKQQEIVQTREKIEQVSDAYNKAKSNIGKSDDFDFDIDDSELKDVNAEIDKVENNLKRISNINIDFNTKIGNNLNAEDVLSNIDKLKIELKDFGFDRSSINSITKDLDKMNVTVKKVTSSLNQDGSVRLTITGADDMERTVTAIKKISYNAEDAQYDVKNLGITVSQSFGQIEAAAKKIKFEIEIGNFDDDISRVESKFNSLKEKPEAVEREIRSLKQALTDMNIAFDSGNYRDAISANDRYEESLKRIENQLSINVRAEREAAKARQDAIKLEKLKQDKTTLSLTMDNWLKDNSAAAKQFGARIKELQRELKSCDDVRLSGIKSEFKQIQKEAQLAGKNAQTLGDRIKTQFQKYSAYLGVAELFMYAEQGLRDMFEQVKLIDSAMTELKKVTDETDATYNQFLRNAGERAKEIGTTIDGLVQSTSQFARLGYGFEDAQGLAEVANIYAVVGDEVEGVEGATTSLISTMTAFKDEMNGLSNADFSMKIIDVFNELGNKFAISSGGLGEAFQRAASSMSVSGNTLSETASLITAANTVVQNPEKVGNAFKTISMRLRAAKTEMEELGEDTSGMAESTASLRAEMLALTGVDLMENETTFKSTFKFLQELSGKWEHLTDIQRANCLPDYIEIYN